MYGDYFNAQNQPYVGQLTSREGCHASVFYYIQDLGVVEVLIDNL